jgi:hypothetical protein
LIGRRANSERVPGSRASSSKKPAANFIEESK